MIDVFVAQVYWEAVPVLSVRSAGSEFQIVGAAWQNARTAENSPVPGLFSATRVLAATPLRQFAPGPGRQWSLEVLRVVEK